LWAAFKARPRSYKIRLVVVLVGTVAAIVTAMPFQKSSTRRLTSDENPVPVKLEDGSRILLLSHSELKVTSQHADDLEVKIVAGSARFQIARNPKRRFRVVATDLEASTTRGALTVKAQNGGPRFSVDEGEIELRRLPEPTLLARLHAGESWPASESPSHEEKTSAKPDPAAPPAPQAGSAAPVPEGAAR
jgi:ferric-dicitrate binding protein FerR (iron transport regulator)